MNKKKLLINLSWIILWIITVILIILSKITEETTLVMSNGTMSSTIVYDATNDQ